MDTYTKEPWYVETGMVCADKPNGTAYLLKAYRNDPLTSPTERDANTRLASAAPDLLVACAAMLAAFSRTAGNHEEKHHAMTLACAAVDKATKE